MKQCLWLSVAGAIGCGLGDTFRKLAMFHAGSNFNHIVQGYKQVGPLTQSFLFPFL